jgi:sorting nexin-41/42
MSIYATLADSHSTDHDQSSPLSSHNPSPSDDPQFAARPNDLSDYEEEEYRQSQSGQLPRKGGYDGRIQQILYENPDLEIFITDAGKSHHGSFIEYRIRTGV